MTRCGKLAVLPGELGSGSWEGNRRTADAVRRFFIGSLVASIRSKEKRRVEEINQNEGTSNTCPLFLFNESEIACCRG
jgi:hypothetical protein